ALRVVGVDDQAGYIVPHGLDGPTVGAADRGRAGKPRFYVGQPEAFKTRAGWSREHDEKIRMMEVRAEALGRHAPGEDHALREAELVRAPLQDRAERTVAHDVVAIGRQLAVDASQQAQHVVMSLALDHSADR